MQQKIKNLWKSRHITQLLDTRNLVLYIFALVVLAVSWSGVKTVQNNYELQKKISVLKQENEVIKLQNDNAYLQNQYLKTDQYLELAARQSLGLAAPGEKVLLVPKNVAMKYIDPTLNAHSSNDQNNKASDTRSKYVKNLEDWRDFLLGRKLFSN